MVIWEACSDGDWATRCFLPGAGVVRHRDIEGRPSDRQGFDCSSRLLPATLTNRASCTIMMAGSLALWFEGVVGLNDRQGIVLGVHQAA